jgi:hypothetical protein
MQDRLAQHKLGMSGSVHWETRKTFCLQNSLRKTFCLLP